MTMGRVAVSPRGGDGRHRGHVAPKKPRVVGRSSPTIRNLKTTCPREGFPLGKKVDDRYRFFDS